MYPLSFQLPTRLIQPLRPLRELQQFHLTLNTVNGRAGSKTLIQLSDHRNSLFTIVGWMVYTSTPLENTCLLLETVNITLFGKRVFNDVTKLRILRWDHSGISGWSLNPMTRAIIRRGWGTADRQKRRRHCDSRG